MTLNKLNEIVSSLVIFSENCGVLPAAFFSFLLFGIS